MQLQAALEAFQVQLAADGRSEHTRRQYRRHVAGLIAWLTNAHRPTTAESITPQVVAEFFASDDAKSSCRGGPKKATSANAQRTSLRCFLRWLHESGTTTTNAGRLLRRALCAPPPPKALHADEQHRLRDALGAATGAESNRDHILIELLLGTGIRIGSAIGLDIEDIDLGHGELTLRKSKNDRPATAVLPKGTAEMLRVFVSDRTAGPLFLAGGRRLSMRHAQRRIARWLTAAGIRGRSAHALRHTFATRIYSTTGDLQVTQAALGHASIASTVIYARLDRARLRAAVGA
ncbi:MAG: tyrosine-type recombinase/integrase [Planctomycetes bacterium]|nr:tyrosine-type recombinase/integrase [Planctomycetota bacterium]